MGYHVVLLADSTSRWAEASRNFWVGLEEDAQQKRIPAYWGRVWLIYERAGFVNTLSGNDGSVLASLGLFRPSGGCDFSERHTEYKPVHPLLLGIR